MKTNLKILFWTPRVICILAILFVSLFALDAFDHGDNIWEKLGAFAMHMIPSFVLLAFLLVAWKWELVGGIIFLLVGIGFSPWVFSHNYQMNHSIGMSLGIIALITIPFIVVGALFVFHHFKLKKT